MARARTTARDELSELGALATLCDVLREKGVVRYSKDGLEIVMGPPSLPKDAKIKTDPLATRRAYYEQMLCRPVGDKELELLP